MRLWKIIFPWAYTQGGAYTRIKIAVFVGWAYTQGAYTRGIMRGFLRYKVCVQTKLILLEGTNHIYQKTTKHE